MHGKVTSPPQTPEKEAEILSSISHSHRDTEFLFTINLSKV